MANPENKLPSYGGQALIEGILMRGRKYVVGAFRKPDGAIFIESEELQGIYKTKLAKLPFLRGLVILWDSMSLGMKYLTISANLQAEEEDEKIEGGALALTLLISIAFSIALFFVLPTLITGIFTRFLNLSNFFMNLIEGLVRLAILLLYLRIIGFSKDIERVFQYHGAEHKTINAFENNMEINVDEIKNFTRAHARCGTSFLLTLVIISVIVFSLLGPMSFWMRVISRILMVPFLAMISYEIIKWMGDNLDNSFVRFISKPNLILQELTTREPDDDQIEIAVAAFSQLLTLENS